jgi:hypothetical protein
VTIRDDVKFLSDARAAILKLDAESEPGCTGTKGTAELDTAIAQLVSQAVAAEEVIDLHQAAGIERPERSVLSDEFLDRLTRSERPNPQMAVLRRLPDDQIGTIPQQRGPGPALLGSPQSGGPPVHQRDPDDGGDHLPVRGTGQADAGAR